MDVFNAFDGVDHIMHAGDIGDPAIITELESIAPVTAIYGNIDTWPIISTYPLMQTTEIQKHKILLIHEITNIKSFRFELFKKKFDPEIVVYGHTHIPGHEFYQNVLFINPGSASRPKGSKQGSVAILNLVENNPEINPEYFEISWR